MNPLDFALVADENIAPEPVAQLRANANRTASSSGFATNPKRLPWFLLVVLIKAGVQFYRLLTRRAAEPWRDARAGRVGLHYRALAVEAESDPGRTRN